MITGPRGIGKSHLLTLLYHKMKNDERLSKQWITVLFPEELRMANDLAKFLERTVSEILLELERDRNPISSELKKEIIKTKETPLAERNEHLFNLLNWIHQTTGRFILLIIENLQQLLGKKISEIEQKKLRAFLQTHDSVLLISSATSVFNILHDHKQPFYHFFHLKRLNDMSFDEMKSLIANLMGESGGAASISKNEARLRAIHSFTGGNPRLAVFLSEILKTDVPDEMLDFMDELLDELSPYFEAILNDTPDYMEEVMNTLATFEPAQSPKEIADHLEAEQSTIRNYLKQMKDNGYVRVAFSKGNSNFYCLSEYLYRIWYQMRDSSHREETRWIMELLMMLYSPSAIAKEKNRLSNCIPGIINESYIELINKTADFINKNPNYCRVIEWCVDSAQRGGKIETIDKRDKSLFIKAAKHKKDRNYVEAIKTYQAILKINPREEDAYCLWGECLEEQEKYEEAIIIFKKALEINSKHATSYWNWGHCLRKLAQYDNAIEKFKTVLELDPKYASAYGAWGDCLRDMKLYAEAEGKYRQSIIVDPTYEDAYRAWGSSLRWQERYKESIEKYQKAAQINPTSAAAYWGWGACLRELKQYEEAIDKFKKALEIRPDNAPAYGAWGDCLYYMNRYPEAEEKYRQAVEIDHEYVDAYNAWGHLLNEQQRCDEAIEKFKLALNIDVKRENAFAGWLESLMKQGKYSEAIELVQGKSAEINDCFTVLLYGKSLLKVGRYQDAIKQFETLLNHHHDCGKVYILHGEALEKSGNRQKAILSYLAHIGLMSTESRVYAEFHANYDQYIVPILTTLDSEYYIKHIYSNINDVKLSMTQVCTLLILMDKYDIVADQLQSMFVGFTGIDDREQFDFNVMIFAIKLKIWLGLIEEKMYEALKVTQLFTSYVMLLKELKGKEDAVSKFVLGIFKLQARFNVKPEYTLKILDSLKKTGVPFNDLFIKVWTCLSDSASTDAQKYLADKAIAELVQQIRSSDTNSDSACKV